MTRFWITLQQGVDFVLKNFERMHGGEIFVPKIPSVRIVDLAQRMAPELPHEVVGIRPGEKLHEVMCPADDSHLTLEFDDHYVIQPTIQFCRQSSTSRVNQLGEQGRPVEQGFEYHSGPNPHFLTIPEIVALNRRSPASDDPLRPAGHHAGRHRRGRRGAALGLPDARAGRARVSSRRSPRAAARRMRVAVNSATSALHIACLALGLGPGDCAVDHAEHLRRLGQLRAATAAPTSTSSTSIRDLEHERPGARGKACTGAATRGPPAEGRGAGALRRAAGEQEAICGLAQEFGFTVIEDASHAIGGVAERRTGRQLPLVAT